MPNSLKPGMCNLPLNMTLAERAVWGRLACSENRSTGDFIKQLLLKALQDVNADAAEQIASSRAERLRLKHGVTAALIIAISLAPLFGDFAKALRARAKRRDDVVCFEDSWTADPLDDVGPVDWANILEVV